jgi:uncharacterized membrane protein YdjX (TVP38/TMEM64 family)
MNDAADLTISPQPPTPPSTRNLRILQVLTVVIISVAVAGTVWLQGQHELLDRIGRSPWALPALFAVSVISSATLFLPVPGLAVTTLVGSLLNPVTVGSVAGIGQTLGEMTGYMAGYSGKGLVGRTKTYERIEGWMQHNEFAGELAVFVLALIPNPLFDAAGMAAGALRFPAWKFLLAAGLGKVIKNIVFAYGGSLGIGWLSRFFGVDITCDGCLAFDGRLTVHAGRATISSTIRKQTVQIKRSRPQSADSEERSAGASLSRQVGSKVAWEPEPGPPVTAWMFN